MPSVSGRLNHAGARYSGIGNLSGIPNVSITLYDRTNGTGLAILTNGSGDFTFNTVPNGTYYLIETGKEDTTNTSPGDFSQAITMSIPTGSDPAFSKIVTPIVGTNIVDSLSPNTLIITVSGSNLTNQNFTDSTIKNTPLSIPSGVTVGTNILTNAGNGEWGTLPAGTAVNTRPATYPYTNSMTTGFTYLSNGNIGSSDQFTMVNIRADFWLFHANHTTFDETSSCIAMNGGNPNVILFYETIDVTPNSYYLAGAWLNMITDIPGTCLIGFKVLAQDNVTQLFYGQTSDIRYAEWSQIGQIFSTKNNSRVTVQVLTMSSIAGGNDFSLDDVSLQPVSFSSNVTIDKRVDLTEAKPGDTLVYTNVINTSSNINKVYFMDTLPTGISLIPGTVFIDGVTQPSYNPIVGFTMPNIVANGISTVTFSVLIDSSPSSVPIENKSYLKYELEIIPGNPVVASILSNTVVTTLLYVEFDIQKEVDKTYVQPGSELVYTIKIKNTGNINALSCKFSDTIPNGVIFIDDSVEVNGVAIIGGKVAKPDYIDLGTLIPLDVTTVTFKVAVM